MSKRWWWAVRIVLFSLVTGLFQWRASAFLPFTGDEPHYLLTVVSLAKDGDANLANNYVNGDTAAIGIPGLTPQGPPSAPGVMPANHGVGFPLLITIPYMLLGALGTRVLLAALMGVATPMLVAAASEYLTGSLLAGTAAGVMVACSATWQLYVDRFLPECCAGLFSAVILYLAMTRFSSQDGRTHSASALVIGASLGYFPFLYLKYSVIAAMLLAGCMMLAALRRNVWFYIGLACSGALAFVLTLGTYGWNVASGSGGGFQSFTRDAFFNRFWAHWFDKGHGLVPFQPVYLLALWAVPEFLKVSRRGGRSMLFWLALAAIAYAILYGLFIGYPGETAPGRFLCASEPILAVIIVQWLFSGGPFQRVREDVFVAFLAITISFVLFPVFSGKGPWTWLSSYLGSYSSYFPAASFVDPHQKVDVGVSAAAAGMWALGIVAVTKAIAWNQGRLTRLVARASKSRAASVAVR